jgi:hypothetical protein
LCRLLTRSGGVESNRAARGVLSALLPRLLHEDAADSNAATGWETADARSCASPSLRWLVWPEADDRSAARLARLCPRITLVRGEAPARLAAASGCTPPTATLLPPLCGCETERVGLMTRDSLPGAARRSTLAPPAADLAIPMGAATLAGSCPHVRLSVCWPAHLLTLLKHRAALAPLLVLSAAADDAPASFVPAALRPPPRTVHIAERFRLAYVARELRLAPKRAKNARQRQRRHAASTSGSEGSLARCAAAALRAGGASALLRADALPVDGLHIGDD